MNKSFPTKNDLPEGTRHEMIALLNESLASGLDLVLQAKQAHWNVKGPSFLPLHELFDKVYEGATEWVDDMAERAVQLGGLAEGTLQAVTKRTKLPSYDLALTDGRDHLQAISSALSLFGKAVRGAIDVADKAGDADTADLFTEVSRGVDKMLWFVEAHLQGQR